MTVKKRKKKKSRGRASKRSYARSSTALRSGRIVTRRIDARTLRKLGLKAKKVGTANGKTAYKLVKASIPKKSSAPKKSRRKSAKSGPPSHRGWAALGFKPSDWMELPDGSWTVKPHPKTAHLTERERYKMYMIEYAKGGERNRVVDTGASMAIHGYNKVGDPILGGVITSIRPLTAAEEREQLSGYQD